MHEYELNLLTSNQVKLKVLTVFVIFIFKLETLLLVFHFLSFLLLIPMRFHSTHHRLNTSSYSLLYTYGHTPYVWMPMHEPNHLNSYYHWIFLPMIRRKIAPWRTSPHFSYSQTLMNYIIPNSNSKCVLFFYISCFSMNFWLKQTKSDENWTSTTDNLMFVCAPGAYIVFLWWNCFLYICYFFSEKILYL